MTLTAQAHGNGEGARGTVAAEPKPPRGLFFIDLLSEAERIARFGTWKWHIASGRVTWSDELHHIYGVEPGEFGGTTDAFLERVHPGDRERVWSHISHSLETLESFAFTERVIQPDGTECTLLSQGRVIADHEGTPEALVGVCHDVTERTLAEKALGASKQRMREIMDNTPSLITVKDLDGRYVMNNAEAARIAGVAGGDLTGMHCTDLFPPEIAEVQRVNDKRAATEGIPVYGEATITLKNEERTYMTVTFPLADERGVPAETCTIATDVTERKEQESERRDRLEWTAWIGSALDEERLVAYAEPIFDLRTGERFSSELLARIAMPGETAELAHPERFMPAAERYGLVQAIDLRMVRKAVKLASAGRIEVNLSAVTLCDPAAREEIQAVLASAPEEASRIVFEVTETADPDYLEAAREFGVAVTSAGARLTLDDFGVGFGSFTYLRTLPVSFLKIDRGFVRGLAGSDDRRLVQTVIGVAREFGLETIAEGVEDATTLELLRSLGADYAQGYHLGRAQPA